MKHFDLSSKGYQIAEIFEKGILEVNKKKTSSNKINLYKALKGFSAYVDKGIVVGNSLVYSPTILEYDNNNNRDVNTLSVDVMTMLREIESAK